MREPKQKTMKWSLGVIKNRRLLLLAVKRLNTSDNLKRRCKKAIDSRQLTHRSNNKWCCLAIWKAAGTRSRWAITKYRLRLRIHHSIKRKTLIYWTFSRAACQAKDWKVTKTNVDQYRILISKSQKKSPPISFQKRKSESRLIQFFPIYFTFP